MAKKPKTMKVYTEEEKAKALALVDSGIAVKEVAKQIGANQCTVHDWLNKRKNGELRTTPIFQAVYEQQKDCILNTMLNLQVQCLEHARKNLEKASPYQAVLMAGILQDKMLAANGNNPNANNNTVNIMLNNISDDEATKLMEKVIARSQQPK
ncbi:MAG: transposase [Aminipila sp.]